MEERKKARKRIAWSIVRTKHEFMYEVNLKVYLCSLTTNLCIGCRIPNQIIKFRIVSMISKSIWINNSLNTSSSKRNITSPPCALLDSIICIIDIHYYRYIMVKCNSKGE